MGVIKFLSFLFLSVWTIFLVLHNLTVFLSGECYSLEYFHSSSPPPHSPLTVSTMEKLWEGDHGEHHYRTSELTSLVRHLQMGVKEGSLPPPLSPLLSPCLWMTTFPRSPPLTFSIGGIMKSISVMEEKPFTSSSKICSEPSVWRGGVGAGGVTPLHHNHLSSQVICGYFILRRR